MNDERMNDIQEVRLTFDPGKGGSVGLRAVTAICGDRVGALPTPTKRGHRFLGWYTVPNGTSGGKCITSSAVLREGSPSAITLYAHWEKEKGKSSSLLKQKKAIVALLVAVALLIGGLVVTNYVISIYRYEDVDGTIYTIKKKDGEYGLYHKNGSPCDRNDDGYYLTSSGTQLSIDKEDGSYAIYAVVDTEGTELVGVSQRVLAFKQLTYDKSSTDDLTRVIKSIEIHNQNGLVDLYRMEDWEYYTPSGSANNYYVVRGHETLSLSQELFAQLASGCGYTISMQRLENPVRLPDGSIDFAEYGLAPEQRVKTDENGDPVKDEQGNEVMYDYTPTWYTIKTIHKDAATGLDSYTMTIGDEIVSGAGYYARYEGRDTIYILGSTNLGVALQPVESLLTPIIVYPMTTNSYFNVENFVLRTDIDHDRLALHMAAELAGLLKDSRLDMSADIESLPEDLKQALSAAIEEIERLTETEGKSDEQIEADTAKWVELYNHAWNNCSRVVTAFSYKDLSQRANSLLSTYPYVMSSSYMSGYMPNANNISSMLQTIHSMVFNGVKVLAPTDEQLDAYGLLDFAYDIAFTYIDEDGEKHDSHAIFSAKTEDGLYYAYSDAYDMIVELDESQAAFLAWEDIDWYDRSYFQYNIAHIVDIKMEGTAISALGDTYLKDGSILLRFDNSASPNPEGSETISSENLITYINGEAMTYPMDIVRTTGRVETMTGVQNARYFVQSLLTASIEGEAELTEQEMADLRTTDDEECFLKLTVNLDDGQGKVSSESHLVYRFYRISERKCYMTVEVLASRDSTSSPTRAQGRFYVLRSFCDKLAADAQRLQDRVQVYPDSKN